MHSPSSTPLHPRTRPSFCMSLRTSAHTGAAIRVPWLRRSTLHHCPGARIPTKLVIANQCAHWCGNPFSPQRNLASWHYFWQIRSTFPYSPKVLLSVMPCRRRSGLPRRFAPRNDNGGTSLHPQQRPRLLPATANHVLAPAHTYPPPACHRKPRTCNRAHLPVFSMSLRTSAHTGAAIRVPAGKANKLAILWANSYPSTNSP